jgi:hypothetical protein
MGEGMAVGVSVGVGVFVAALVAVLTGIAVGSGDGVEVGVALGVASLTGVEVSAGVAVAVGVLGKRVGVVCLVDNSLVGGDVLLPHAVNTIRVVKSTTKNAFGFVNWVGSPQ